MESGRPHEHNSEETFDKLLNLASVEAVGGGGKAAHIPLNSDEQLRDNPYPEEERERSQSISAILRHYEYSYKNKVEFQCWYRKILFWGCVVIISIFTYTTLKILTYTMENITALDFTGVAAVITATLSLVVSIMELVHTITKYCFPQNDEEYIVRIVESIQNHSLEKTKESNRSAEARNGPGNSGSAE